MWRITSNTAKYQNSNLSEIEGTHVKLEQNKAIPAILNRIPTKSNLFNVAKLSFSVTCCVLGTVQTAATKKKT
jgi:hypothetical protein